MDTIDTAQTVADAAAVLLAAHNNDNPGLAALLQDRTHGELIHISAFLAAYAANKTRKADSLTGTDSRASLHTVALTHYANATRET